MLTKIKAFVKNKQKGILISLCGLLLLSLAFIIGLEIGAGFFKRPPIIIKSEPLEITEQNQNPPSAGFVASINGKYYYPLNCSYANRIKAENRIFFQTEEEAQSRGFKPYASCF